MTTLQTYIYKLRKDLLEHCASAQLYTKVSGYLLDVSAERGDLFSFERLVLQGRAALEDGDPHQAGDLLSQALKLWRGPALADVAVGGILSAHVTRLEEDRLRALDLRIEADLQLGRHLELISELKVLVSEHPLQERFHTHLMLALHRSGRRHEALDVYQGLRRVLIDELGLEPSASVQRLHLALLGSDSSLENGPSAAGTSGKREMSTNRERLMVPAQLPPDIADFAGRHDVLQRVRQHLVPCEEGSTAARVVSISGMAGTGKTALALRAAHLERSAFPDGQLFANLRGTTEDPADPPLEILEGFLRAIGIPPHQVPDTLEERSKLFRTWSTGQRVLIVLDDAASVSQVAPLLPASPDCAVIITNRWGLYGIPGAQHVELGVVSLDEGVELLGPITGFQRIRDERLDAERIVRLCGHLPLALRSVGSRLAATRTWPLRKMASQLEDARGRLDELRFGDLDVRSRYDASYWSLAAEDRSAFRLISLLPPPDFSAATAARLIGSSPDAVEAQLIRLVGCHLLEIRKATGGEIRYALHELIRLYARERLDMEFIKTPGERPTEPVAPDNGEDVRRRRQPDAQDPQIVSRNGSAKPLAPSPLLSAAFCGGVPHGRPELERSEGVSTSIAGPAGFKLPAGQFTGPTGSGDEDG